MVFRASFQDVDDFTPLQKTLAKGDLCFADIAGLLGLPGQNICSMSNASGGDIAEAVEEAAGLGCEET